MNKKMKGMVTQDDIEDSIRDLFSRGKDKSSSSNSLRSKPLKNNPRNENKSEPQLKIQSEPKPRSDRPPRPIKITEKTRRSLQWITLIILFSTLGYAFLTLDFTSINSIFSSSSIMPIVLGFIAVFFLWQFTSDQLGQFPLEIVEARPRRQRQKRKTPTPNPNPVSSGASVLDLQTKMYGGSPIPTTTLQQPQQLQHEGGAFDKTSLMIVTVGIIFVFMLCIWAVDMAVTALRLEAAGYIAKLDNGWMLQNPALVYHLALYTMILLVAVLVMIAMLNLIRRTDIPWLPLFKARPQAHSIPVSSGKTVLFSMIGYTTSMAFTVMVMIFLAVSWTGTKGLTVIYWNHFGEHNIETLIFVVAFVLISVGFYFTFKNFRETVKARRSNR
jgi:uncharacterized membrane protein YhaH (DUF805 family)